MPRPGDMDGMHGRTDAPPPVPSELRHLVLVARREWTMLRRSHGAWGAIAVLFGVAWLPSLLAAGRAGSLGLAPFTDTGPVALSFGGVILPLLGLLVGADALAGEMEARSLPPLLGASISRRACYAGKLAGTTAALGVGYVVAFAGAAAAIAATNGLSGASDYATVATAGFALTVSCLGVGAAIAAAGRGRVRAYAGALVAWMALVIVVDAVLLSALIAVAPSPPAEIGRHGHDELAATAKREPAPQLPTAAHESADGEAAEGAWQVTGGSAYPWFMFLDPVDLYRLTVLRAGPQLRASWLAGGSPETGSTERAALLFGWFAWLVLPAAVGLRRFRRAPLV